MLSGDELTPLLSQPILNVQPGVPVFLQDALAGEGLKIDGFRLASSRGQMKITVELQDPNIHPRVQLYTSDLRRVAGANFNGLSMSQEFQVYVSSESTYLLTVSGEAAEIGYYTVTVQTEPTDDLPNTPAQAQPIAMSASGVGVFRGVLDYPGDADVVSLTAQAGLLRVVIPTGLNDAGRVRVLDATGRVLGQSQGLRSGTTFSCAILSAGQYFVSVEGLEQTTGRYIISATSTSGLATPEAQNVLDGLTWETVPTPLGNQLVIAGTPGSDRIVLSQSADGFVLASTGQRVISGAFTSVVINAGAGNDFVRVESSVMLSVSVTGEAGDDSLFVAGQAADSVSGGDGDDLLVTLGGGADSFDSGAGLDRVWYEPADVVSGMSIEELQQQTYHMVGEFLQPFNDDPASPQYISLLLAGQNLPDGALPAGAVAFESFSDSTFATAAMLPENLRGRNQELVSLLADLAATHGQRFEELLAPLGDGTYVAELPTVNGPVYLRLDADLAVDASGELVDVDLTQTGEIWPAVLAKAYRQWQQVSGLESPVVSPGMEQVYLESLAGFQAASDMLGPETYRTSADGTELAWREAYVLESFVRMYEATGETQYLDRLIGDFDVMLANRNDRTGVVDYYRGRAVAGWATTSPGLEQHVWFVDTGNIGAPVARWLYLVKRDPLLWARYGEKAAEYEQALREMIAVFDKDWMQDTSGLSGPSRWPVQGEGWYWDSDAGWTMPLDMVTSMGRLLTGMWLATGDSVYLDRATRIARYFKNCTTVVNDSYVWTSAYSTRIADMGHGSIDVSFAYDAYKAGIVFDATDMQRFVQTFHRLTVRDDSGKVIGWRTNVDGTGAIFSGFHEYWQDLGQFDPLVIDAVRAQTRFHGMAGSSYMARASTQFRFDLPVTAL